MNHARIDVGGHKTSGPAAARGGGAGSGSASAKRTKIAVAIVLLVAAAGILTYRLIRGGEEHVDDAIVKRAEEIRADIENYGPVVTEAPAPAPPPPKTPAKAVNRGPQKPGG
jgi:hypothetical protein